MARPTPDEAALLRTICATPADDLPRLVYADWLEENGRSERAEFIRLQVGLSEQLPRSRHYDRLERIKELFDTHKQTWYQEVPKWARYRKVEYIDLDDYSRGFLTELSVDTSPFLQFGVQILDRIPLQRVELCNANKLLPQLATCPWLARLHHLDLSYMSFNSDAVVALADSRYLQSVQELNLRCSDVNDIGTRALANSRFIRGLKVLDLRWNRISIGAVKVLANSPNLQNLVQLDLRGNQQLQGYEGRIEDWFGKRVVIHDDVE